MREVADRRDDEAACYLEEPARAERPPVLDGRALELHRLDARAAQDLHRVGEEVEMHALGAFARLDGNELAQGGQVALDQPPVALGMLAGDFVRQRLGIDDRRAILEPPHLAQFDIGEAGLDGAPAAGHVDRANGRAGDRRAGVVGDVGAGHLANGLGQHAGDIDGDVAEADDDDGFGVERRVQVAEIGVAVVPADERGDPDDAHQLRAGDAELAVAAGPGGQHDGVVETAQGSDGDIAADLDIAEEAHAFIERGFLVGAGDVLGLGVVGGDATADQPVGGGQALDDVEGDIGAGLQQRLGGIEPGRPRADDCHAYRHALARTFSLTRLGTPTSAPVIGAIDPELNHPAPAGGKAPEDGALVRPVAGPADIDRRGREGEAGDRKNHPPAVVEKDDELPALDFVARVGRTPLSQDRCIAEAPAGGGVRGRFWDRSGLGARRRLNDSRGRPVVEGAGDGGELRLPMDAWRRENRNGECAEANKSDPGGPPFLP